MDFTGFLLDPIGFCRFHLFFFRFELGFRWFSVLLLEIY